MMRSITLGLLIAIGVGALACQSSPGTDSEGATPTQESVAAPLESPASNATFPEVIDPAAASATQDDEDRLRLLQDQQEKLVQQYVNRGREYYERGEFERAQEAYAHALDLDPNNTEARDRFNEIGELLGQRTPSEGSIFTKLSDTTAVRWQQIRLSVDRLVRQGDRELESGNYAAAIENYENALLIVRANPEPTADVHTEMSVRRLIEEANRGKRVEEQRLDEELRGKVLEQREREARDEQERYSRRIRKLFEEANSEFQGERYRNAERLSEQILEIDPTNEAALELRSIAAKARYAKTDREIRSDYNEQWKRSFEAVSTMNMPQVTTLLFDTERWREVVRRKPVEFSPAEETLSPAEREMLDRLATTSVPSINFDDTPMETALGYLSDISSVNILVSPAVLANFGEDELLVSLTLEDTTVQRVLDLITETKGLKSEMRYGAVSIVPGDQPASNLVLNFYDVRDLTKTVSDFPGREMNIEPSSSAFGFGDEGLEPELQPRVIEIDRLISLIQDNIDLEMWETNDNANVREQNGTLVVRAPRATHNKIKDLLDDLRESTGLLVSIEARFITVEDNFLEDVGVDLRGLGDDTGGVGVPGRGVDEPLDDFGLPGSDSVGVPGAPAGPGTGNDSGAFFDDGSDGDLRGRVENLFDQSLGTDDTLTNSGGFSLQYTYLDDTQLEVILRAVQKSERSNIVYAPKITVYNTQRANLSVLNQVSYIKDFDPEIAQAAIIADPIIDVIEDGVVLDVRPVVSSDRRYVTLELRPTVAALVRPIPTFTTGLGIGAAVSIQLPELEVQRVRTTVTVPDGGTLLLGGMKVSTEQTMESGIPFFRDIPVLGFLFGRKAKFNERKNLIIIVRAHIVIPEEHEPTLGRQR